MITNSCNSRQAPKCRTQSGAALLISLIMLLVMTVLAVTTTRTTTLQERMAGNLRNKDIAFQGAEIALRTAENEVEGFIGGYPPVPQDPGACGGCSVLVSGQQDPLADATWASGGGLTEIPPVTGTGSRPQYYVEMQQTVKESVVSGQSTDERVKLYYRASARAVGGASTAESILRSVYVLRF